MSADKKEGNGLHTGVVILTAGIGLIAVIAGVVLAMTVHAGPQAWSYEVCPRYIWLWFATALTWCVLMLVYPLPLFLSTKVRRALVRPFADYDESQDDPAQAMASRVIHLFYGTQAVNIGASIFNLVCWSVWWHYARNKADSDLWDATPFPAWANAADAQGFNTFNMIQLVLIFGFSLTFAIHMAEIAADIPAIVGASLPTRARSAIGRIAGGRGFTTM